MSAPETVQRPPSPPPARKIRGVGIAVTEGNRVLGFVSARNIEELQKLFLVLHGANVTVNLAGVKGVNLEIDSPPQTEA